MGITTQGIYNEGRSKWKHEAYESVVDAVNGCKDSCNDYGDWSFGYLSKSECIEKLVHGDNALADKAEGLMNKLDDMELPEGIVKESMASVWGHRLVLGEYLTGSPTPFRRKQARESAYSPLTIAMSMTTAAAISTEQIQNRGIALLALVRKIQTLRPVELVLYAELDYTGHRTGACFVSTKVNTMPLDLATSVFALANPALARGFFYGRIHNISPRSMGGWPEMHPAISKGYTRKWDDLLRQVLGANSNVLLIPSLAIDDPFKNDAVGFVNHYVKKGLESMEGLE